MPFKSIPRHKVFRLFSCKNPANTTGKVDLLLRLQIRFIELKFVTDYLVTSRYKIINFLLIGLYCQPHRWAVGTQHVSLKTVHTRLQVRNTIVLGKEGARHSVYHQHAEGRA